MPECGDAFSARAHTCAAGCSQRPPTRGATRCPPHPKSDPCVTRAKGCAQQHRTIVALPCFRKQAPRRSTGFLGVRSAQGDVICHVIKNARENAGRCARAARGQGGLRGWAAALDTKPGPSGPRPRPRGGRRQVHGRPQQDHGADIYSCTDYVAINEDRRLTPDAVAVQPRTPETDEPAAIAAIPVGKALQPRIIQRTKPQHKLAALQSHLCAV